MNHPLALSASTLVMVNVVPEAGVKIPNRYVRPEDNVAVVFRRPLKVLDAFPSRLSASIDTVPWLVQLPV